MEANKVQTAKNDARAGGKHLNVELMRFVGMLYIMGSHLYLLGYQGEYIFKSCWAWVDFYFLLTGAFTFRHYQKAGMITRGGGSEALLYTLRKFSRFFIPTVAAVLIERGLEGYHFLLDGEYLHFLGAFLYAPYELLYLSSSGIILPSLAPIWYLSAMFIVLPTVVYIMISHKELWKIIAFTFPVLYIGHMGVNTVRSWPNDLLRAFCYISLGTIAVLLADQLRELDISRGARNVLSVIEAASILLASLISVFNLTGINLLAFLFFLICVLLLSEKTWSSGLRSGLISFLGELSMPMFLFHWVVGAFMIQVTKNIAVRTVAYYVGTVAAGCIVWRINRKTNGLGTAKT